MNNNILKNSFSLSHKITVYVPGTVDASTAGDTSAYVTEAAALLSECFGGGAPTLTGAKRLASKTAEYWDNWQGWHIPAIYRAEDVRKVVNFYGETFAPCEGARPVAAAEYNNGRAEWRELDGEF